MVRESRARKQKAVQWPPGGGSSAFCIAPRPKWMAETRSSPKVGPRTKPLGSGVARRRRGRPVSLFCAICLGWARPGSSAGTRLIGLRSPIKTALYVKATPRGCGRGSKYAHRCGGRRWRAQVAVLACCVFAAIALAGSAHAACGGLGFGLVLARAALLWRSKGWQKRVPHVKLALEARLCLGCGVAK